MRPRRRGGRRRRCGRRSGERRGRRGVGDVDGVARLERVDIEVAVELDHRIEIDSVAQADAEEGVADPHGHALRRPGHANCLADAQHVQVQARVLGADRAERGVEFDGDVRRGVAGLDGVAEDLDRRRGRGGRGGRAGCSGGRARDCAADRQGLADLEVVAVNRGVQFEQAVDGGAEALGDGGQRVAGPDFVARAARRRGGGREAELLAGLDRVGRESGVRGEQVGVVDAEIVGDLGEGVALPDDVGVGGGWGDRGNGEGGRCQKGGGRPDAPRWDAHAESRLNPQQGRAASGAAQNRLAIITARRARPPRRTLATTRLIGQRRRLRARGRRGYGIFRATVYSETRRAFA